MVGGGAASQIHRLPIGRAADFRGSFWGGATGGGFGWDAAVKDSRIAHGETSRGFGILGGRLSNVMNLTHIAALNLTHIATLRSLLNTVLDRSRHAHADNSAEVIPRTHYHSDSITHSRRTIAPRRAARLQYVRSFRLLRLRFSLGSANCLPRLLAGRSELMETYGSQCAARALSVTNDREIDRAP